jgi:hypothetical protein
MRIALDERQKKIIHTESEIEFNSHTHPLHMANEKTLPDAFLSAMVV